MILKWNTIFVSAVFFKGEIKLDVKDKTVQIMYSYKWSGSDNLVLEELLWFYVEDLYELIQVQFVFFMITL